VNHYNFSDYSSIIAQPEQRHLRLLQSQLLSEQPPGHHDSPSQTDLDWAAEQQGQLELRVTFCLKSVTVTVTGMLLLVLPEYTVAGPGINST
jgi:hypothetical protein